MLAAICETCGKEAANWTTTMTWPAAFAVTVVAIAAAWMFSQLAKYL